MSNVLNRINGPEDVKKLSMQELAQLCDDIRGTLVEVVSENGGHLASNLGMVETTVALHRVFDCPTDSFVFDVGHQCYAHKLLTGRRERFSTLRREGGLSGFTRPSESPYDMFVAGHASTSVSSAIGLARAKQLSGEGGKVVAIIGDGAFGGGMVFEAVNNIDNSMKNLVVILNDNKMSISKSVGSVSRYLLRLRTGAKYSKLKERVKLGLEKTAVGRGIAERIRRSKSRIRRSIYNGTLFEELGFNYVGPIDGHDLDELVRIFSNVKKLERPTLVHVITTKGKGFTLAEENPGAYHGVGSFDLDKGNPDISTADSFSNTFGRRLCELAGRDDSICAVTAAMKYATGLNFFAKKYRERFFDVGIAEEHAVTFCSGLAKGGMTPVFCVYSTFLQRAFDQLIHDVSLGGLPVMLGIDRAGLVGEDGETHQGIFDVSMLAAVGTFTVASPSNFDELIYWTDRLVPLKCPRAVRYPRGTQGPNGKKHGCTGREYDIISGEERADTAIVTYGREFENVVRARDIASARGIFADIAKINLILPLPDGLTEELSRYGTVIFAEEGIRSGGIAELLSERLRQAGFKGRYIVRAIDERVIRHGSVERQTELLGLDGASLAGLIFREAGRHEAET